MEMKSAQDGQSPKKKDQDRRLPLPDFKTYYQLKVAKTVAPAQGRHGGQWNSTVD